MEHYILGDIWFVLWAVLWGVYFMLDGYDFGIGMLLPVFGLGSDRETKVLYKVTGPFWDGNEVWLITAGGVTFAAFPLAYAVLFSSLYTPLLLLLLMLILRGVAAEFRANWDNSWWGWLWDLTMAGTGVVASLLLGVAFSNLFIGLPLSAGHIYEGGLLDLLNLYALLGGIFFVIMFLTHGAIYLAYRTEGSLHDKAKWTARLLWPAFLFLFLLYVVLTFTWGGLYENYFAAPALLLLPLACLAAFIRSGWVLYGKTDFGCAFFWSCAGILLLTLTGVMGMYPYLIPSSLDPSGALSILNSASSPKTLGIMLGVAVVFVPLVILYQWWAHRTLAEKLRAEYE